MNRIRIVFSISSLVFGVSAASHALLTRAALVPRDANASAKSFELAATPREASDTYTIQVSFGGQSLAMMPDTGSSDTWVIDTAFDEPSPGLVTEFNPAESSSLSFIPGSSFNITYVDTTSVAGRLATDTVDMGNVHIDEQTFGLPVDVNIGNPADLQYSGVLALGFSSGSKATPGPVKTILESLTPYLNQPVFTVYLPSNAGGYYEFGSIDNAKYFGQLNYIPVNSSPGSWAVSVTSFAVPASPQLPRKGYPTYIDSGSSNILLTATALHDYFAKVPGSVHDNDTGNYHFPCDAMLPDLGLTFGDIYSASNSSIYTTVVPREWILLIPLDNSSRVCCSMLQPSNSEYQVLGIPFFHSQFLVFDFGTTPRLGLAPLRLDEIVEPASDISG